jgi:hypothetical protein
MVEVCDFTFCAVDVDVDQDYVGCQIRQEKGEGCGCPDRAGANDGDFDALDGLWRRLAL